MAARREPAPAAGSREVLVHVEEHGAGHVARPPGVAAPAGGIEVPAHVGHDEAGLPQAGGQPPGADERVHPAYFSFVTGWGTFL